MSFDTVERSVQDGKPVELYTFQRDAAVWRYTSGDRDRTVSGDTYTAAVITRNSIESGSELARSPLQLEVPRDFAVADLWRVAPPTSRVTVLLRQYHDGDGELVTLWAGRVLNVEFEGARANITCEPVFTTVRRIGLRRLYQRQCPHVLYGARCGVDKAAHDVAGTVSAISGSALTITAAGSSPDGHFAGGYLEFQPSAGVYERRFIEAHTGSTITLMGSAFGLAVSSSVTLYPGCDHTLATCNSKFSNAANYGGMPFMPEQNPFGGSPVL